MNRDSEMKDLKSYNENDADAEDGDDSQMQSNKFDEHLRV